MFSILKTFKIYFFCNIIVGAKAKHNIERDMAAQEENVEIHFIENKLVSIRRWSCSLFLDTTSSSTRLLLFGSGKRLCADDGWFNQLHQAESDWTLGLVGAAHLLHIE